MSEPTLIDTSVLVYSCLEEDSRYQACRAVLTEARSPDGNLCVVQQVLTEFYAVITNRKQVTAHFEPDEALAEIDNYLAAPGITLLTQPADLTTRTLGLLRRSGEFSADCEAVESAGARCWNDAILAAAERRVGGVP